ncbi:hypothetical protein ED733_003051 [Metarhizium rileyi]|uniref:Uncharacterized protein n=1 Tax=Metarhizium rileyi (strain RCEF 4871) TaxID=1649241 RepID=A0A5C6GCY0_METRR|nr:hypothetical protein ED733_003051 [Metarhizium rileyi]
MARPQDPKRQRASEPSPDNSPVKRARLSRESRQDNFSPAFWDNLSKVPLTLRALRELDRRNNTRDPPTSLAPRRFPQTSIGSQDTVVRTSSSSREVKSPDGGASVAQHQACYDGAHGARAIHALQNYEETEPIFDGNAYTYSSTYHSGTGTLQLYAHHITAPTTADEQPEYHMTQIDGWQTTGNINSFRRGATAFRNARDSAERYRNSFIKAANARASRAAAAVQGETNTSLDLRESGGDEACLASHDAANALEQHDTKGIEFGFTDENQAVAPMPRDVQIEEGLLNPSQAPMTPALDELLHSKSNISTLDTEMSQYKRPRQSVGPPSNRKRAQLYEGSTGRHPSGRVASPAQPEEGNSH